MPAPHLCRGLQEPSESVEQGAPSSFTDSGVSWDDLQQKVQQRQAELQWETPDLENVCHYLPCCVCALYLSDSHAHKRKSPVGAQGPANARALKRSFGKGSKPVLKLYRCFWFLLSPCLVRFHFNPWLNHCCSTCLQRPRCLVSILPEGLDSAGGEADTLRN